MSLLSPREVARQADDSASEVAAPEASKFPPEENWFLVRECLSCRGDLISPNAHGSPLKCTGNCGLDETVPTEPEAPKRQKAIGIVRPIMSPPANVAAVKGQTVALFSSGRIGRFVRSFGVCWKESPEAVCTIAVAGAVGYAAFSACLGYTGSGSPSEVPLPGPVQVMAAPAPFDAPALPPGTDEPQFVGSGVRRPPSAVSVRKPSGRLGQPIPAPPLAPLPQFSPTSPFAEPPMLRPIDDLPGRSILLK